MAEDALRKRSRDVLVIDERLAEKIAQPARDHDVACEFHTATGVQDGIAATRELRPPVVVCARRLTDGSGIDYCREIKADPELRSTHLIVVAGRAVADDVVLALEAGADELIRGPFDPRILTAKIRTCLRSHAIREQGRREQYRKLLLQVAATIGHRINNPLTGILGHLELVRMYLERGEAERVEHHLQEAGRDVHRIGDLSCRLTVMADPKVTTYLDRALGLDRDTHPREDRHAS